ncbi:MAG TPA: transcriptional repressor LexA [Syntrophorhabdaceae bacterium]|nr:transcriptional repressor LexA [Syntrophorhabdaceae bacterium]HOD74551.1 transcriptional repressor LexA [Syntrophorhabdaceae bacterium]
MPRKTDTRENILDFIRTFRRENGYSPSVREVARHCGIKSPSVVQYHLDQLEQTGLITRDRDRSRSVGIVGEEGEVPQVPLLGVIAAGQPIGVPSADRWNSEAQRMVDVPREVLKSRKDLFALEVRGNSMVDAMIADSDIVVMEQVDDVRNGDVAACWLEREQEVTLKKVYFEKDKVRLQPCNPYMPPLYHDAANVRIQGRVVAVLRMNPR